MSKIEDLPTEKLIHSENMRRAGITTFYRHSILCIAVRNPGIMIPNIAKFFGKSTAGLNTTIRMMEKMNLLRVETVERPHCRMPSLKIYPTPYAKDLVNCVTDCKP